ILLARHAPLPSPAIHEEAAPPQPGVVTGATNNDLARKHHGRPSHHSRPFPPREPALRTLDAACGWVYQGSVNLLAKELHGWDDPQGGEWSGTVKPLAAAIVARYLELFPR